MLSAFPAFRAATSDDLDHSVSQILRAKLLRVGPMESGVESQANFCAFDNTQLWACAYGAPVTLKFPEGDFFRVQIPRAGHAVTRVGTADFPVTSTKSCISSADAEIDFGAGFAQLAWRVPYDFVARKLEALTGHAVIGKIELRPELDLTEPNVRQFLAILDCLVMGRGNEPNFATSLLIKELEQAAVLALISCSALSLAPLLTPTATRVAPWQVRRAEAYIEAHWNQPLDIDNLVAATGVSARSLFRTFKQFRGYSPWQFVKQIRLQKAHALLVEGADGVRVTDIALACGWGDIGQFSKDFTAGFGVSPSGLLKRSKIHGDA